MSAMSKGKDFTKIYNEQRYQGRWGTHMVADYCWTIMTDNISSEHKRRSKKTVFVPKPRNKSDVTPLFKLTEHFYLYFMVMWD